MAKQTLSPQPILKLTLNLAPLVYMMMPYPHQLRIMQALTNPLKLAHLSKGLEQAKCVLSAVLSRINLKAPMTCVLLSHLLTLALHSITPQTVLQEDRVPIEGQIPSRPKNLPARQNLPAEMQQTLM